MGLLCVLVALAGGGCDRGGLSSDMGSPDAARTGDFGFNEGPDLSVEDPLPATCNDQPPDPRCQTVYYPRPDADFSLSTDDKPDPLERENGVARDLDGALKLAPSSGGPGVVWVPNTDDPVAGGTVSKLDRTTARELARYPSTTCYSLGTGSTAPCDGTNGCCAADDWARYQARLAMLPEPGHQAVQRSGNQPSRTSVDYDNNLVVANQAAGGQSSVTRIANPFSCIDRSGDKKIQTSSDADGNGWIDIDCNDDGVADDLASVLAKPCTNGRKQEYFGQDDECVLWTVNVFEPGTVGRTVSLGQGNSSLFDDPWVTSVGGQFARIDGGKVRLVQDGQLPDACSAGGVGGYGTTIDAAGIAWVTPTGPGKLCYFDTKNVKQTGVVRDPQWGPMVGAGLALDRDQNVWIGGEVARYTPDRSNGFKNLGSGWWTRIVDAKGSGIAADYRSFNAYFVYSCADDHVLQIPASTLKLVKADQDVKQGNWPTIQLPCTAVGVDADQNVWGIDHALSTRALIDRNGVVKQPVVNGQPMGNARCPAGDSCPNLGAQPYSDFTSVPRRNIDRPDGTYDVMVPGCRDAMGDPTDTEWWRIDWDAYVSPNTSLTVHAKAGSSTSHADPAWLTNLWSDAFSISPADLQAGLMPNLPAFPRPARDGVLLVEFVFKTTQVNATPKLKSFDVVYRCPSP